MFLILRLPAVHFEDGRKDAWFTDHGVLHSLNYEY